ncbi:hypothetical protein F4553_005010 [Allocatelliglobosispora scoriae]|uniref:Uncharacterized protein n=2 Tax=Allocatelliglobosispora scoriae TaxID=643052 RepID=A0A841BY81_9ACTN|nr:hypothetical protein [Allocatelliglobosispora scoriae]
MLVTRRDLGGAGWDEVALPASSGWSFALRDCVGYHDADYPAQRRRLAVRGTAFSQGRAGRLVQALIELYPPGWSAEALDDVRGVVQNCGRYEHIASLHSHSIVEVDFAGQEALLVHSTEIWPYEEPTEWWTAVVRRDDLVATVTGHGLTDTELRKIAIKAAARLN